MGMTIGARCRPLHPGVLVLSTILVVLSGCSGGQSGSETLPTSTSASSPTAVSSKRETGPYVKAIAVPGSAAVVALFPDASLYYSPDGFNLGGGGATEPAVKHGWVQDIVGLPHGIEALLPDGSVIFSPDGHSLTGGGRSRLAYAGHDAIRGLVPVGTGVDAIFDRSGLIYYSPDGFNLRGGGGSVLLCAGAPSVRQLIPLTGGAVLTLLVDGQAYYSPDNRNLCGGGNTVAAASSGAAVSALQPVGRGVLARFEDGRVFLSSTGRYLDGGPGTVAVAPWVARGNGSFPPRDSASGAQFQNKLWLSGGYALATNSNSCFYTCSFFDLWSSSDLSGATWSTAPAFSASDPDPRDAIPDVNNGVADASLPADFYDAYSPLVVWNNQLVAVGSTVWYSPDGLSWQVNIQAGGTSPSPGPITTPATENSRALVLAGALYFLQLDSGGVYKSVDPTAGTWTSLGSIPGFTPRCGPVAYVSQGQLWVGGGGACDYTTLYHDLWTSLDGVNWVQVPSTAPARMWSCVASGPDGIVWMVGGYAPTDWNNTSGYAARRYAANHSDVWYTRTGADWRQYKADLGPQKMPDDGVFEPRHAPTCYVVNHGDTNELLVLAGTGGPDPDDANARELNSVRALPLPLASSLP